MIKIGLSLAAGLAAFTAFASAATREPGSLTKDDVLSVRDGRFYLGARPFAEISFNKFDLLWHSKPTRTRPRPSPGWRRRSTA